MKKGEKFGGGKIIVVSGGSSAVVGPFDGFEAVVSGRAGVRRDGGGGEG